MLTSKPAPITAHSAQNHRFHLLDALRGILEVLVVFRHSTAILTSAVQTKDIFLAVDFFFCLSGFVIAYAYEERLRTRLCLRDFAVARLIRFYPTFLVGTLLAFFFALGPGHLLAQPGGRTITEASIPSLLFLPSIPLASTVLLFPLNMSSWTLFVELLANFGYAVLVRGRRAAKPVLLAICLGSLGVLAFTPRALDSGSTWPGALVGFARMGLAFPIGVCLLHLWRRSPPQGLLRRTRGLPTAVIITLLLLAVILVPTPFSGQRIYQLVIMTLAIPSFVFFGADIRLGRVGCLVCAALGDLSYPLYIVHLPLLTPLFGSHVARWTHGSWALQHLLAPAYIFVLATIAWALRAYFDAPAGRWLTRRYNRKRSAASATRSAAVASQPQLAQS